MTEIVYESDLVRELAKALGEAVDGTPGKREEWQALIRKAEAYEPQGTDKFNSPLRPTPFTYKGAAIWWRGWQALSQHVHYVGQWIARREGKHFYSSTPGLTGPFYPGEFFNLSRQPKQMFITCESSVEEARVEMEAARDKMISLIDEFVPEGG
jgi:hypothetical protein